MRMRPEQPDTAEGLAPLDIPAPSRKGGGYSDGSESQIELSVVIPVYGGAGCLDALVSAIGDALVREAHTYEIILVNDDSPDESWAIIERLSKQHCNVIGIDLRRN